MVSAAAILGLFRLFLRSVAILAIVLSVIGTYYGLVGRSAPITNPVQIYGEMYADLNRAVVALVVQVVLTFFQWGLWAMGVEWRAQGRRNWQWVFAGYAVALAVSVIYNVKAYIAPMTALGMPGPLAFLVIAGFDFMPERTLIKE